MTKAERLADALDSWDGLLMMPKGWRVECANELRHLEESNAVLLEALRSALFAIEGLVQQQAAPDSFYEPAVAKARAAIAKAEGQ